MGCGRHSQSYASEVIIIANYSLNRDCLDSAHLASPYRVKFNESSAQEPLVSEFISQSNFKSIDPNQVIDSSLSQFSKKEDWNNLSRIQYLREDHVRNLSESPTEFTIKTEEIISPQGFNFDFLNETSYSTKANNKIISDVFQELELIKW